MKLFALFALTILIAACAPVTVPQGNETDPSADLVAEHFGSTAELVSFLRSSNAAGDYYGGVGLARNAVATDGAVAESAPAPTAAGQKDVDHSSTNVQIAGIDELDILKTDGEYIYTTSGQTLFIIKAYPGEDAQVVSSIDLEQYPHGLFLDGDTLAVVTQFYDTDYLREHDLRPRWDLTAVWLYDISDKSEPERTKEYVLEGTYSAGRLIGSDMYLSLQSSPDYRQPLPFIIEDDVARAVPLSSISYFPVPYDSLQYNTVHSIDLGTGELVDSVTVTTEYGTTLYMSDENIYLAATRQINEWRLYQDALREIVTPRLDADERSLIAKIEATDDDVLSAGEKESKIMQVISEHVELLPKDERDALEEEIEQAVAEELEQYPYPQYTSLTRISADDGLLAVAASGTVPGRLNNQFSLDEREDVLRVATTVQPSWGWIRPLMGAAEPAVASDEAVAEKAIAPPSQPSTSENHLYTLDQNLEVLDSVTGIAKGEQIYSTRFIDERLYMVTFRQVDPFFVVDLSDPRDIRVLGELKIPGFSRYLHPYDGDTIIGIGRDATASGRQEGIKISLFDVADPAEPRELASWIADEQYSQTAAEWEHKAFLFDRERELLVLPAYSYSWDERSRDERYNGALVFRVTRDEIELRGLIDHSTASQDYYWQPAVERSLYIEELLYTKSPGLLRINALDDLSSVSNVTLRTSGEAPYPVY